VQVVSAPAPLHLDVGRRHHPIAWVVARVRAPWLDRQLAAGVPPWSSPAHTTRALLITSDRRRRSLARSLETLVERSRNPRLVRGAAVPPCRAQVRRAAPLALSLVSRLRSGSPIEARGVAQLHAVLCDGAGPCYQQMHDEALTVALEEIWQWLTVDD